MYTPYTPDLKVPVKRLQLDRVSGSLVESPMKSLFVRGPIPLAWLRRAARLPGKTINVAVALWWRHGMAKGRPFKLTQMALNALNVGRDAAGAALLLLEQEGLIQVERKSGQRPNISLVTHLADTGSNTGEFVAALDAEQTGTEPTERAPERPKAPTGTDTRQMLIEASNGRKESRNDRKEKTTGPCRAGNLKSKAQSDATQATRQADRDSGRETREPATA